MSSPSSWCASASDFTESHAERACKEAKSTCAGADLPELEGAGASVDGGVRVDIGWWFSFGGGGRDVRCKRWTLFIMKEFLWRRDLLKRVRKQNSSIVCNSRSYNATTTAAIASIRTTRTTFTSSPENNTIQKRAHSSRNLRLERFREQTPAFAALKRVKRDFKSRNSCQVCRVVQDAK